MDKENTPGKFPESGVDALIASFGKKPTEGQMQRINEGIESQRGKFETLSKQLAEANKKDQQLKRGQSL